MSAEQAAVPALRIVRGEPTAEEIAALVGVLAVASGAPEATAAREESQWAAPARLAREAVSPSGWWSSALPR